MSNNTCKECQQLILLTDKDIKKAVNEYEDNITDNYIKSQTCLQCFLKLNVDNHSDSNIKPIDFDEFQNTVKEQSNKVSPETLIYKRLAYLASEVGELSKAVLCDEGIENVAKEIHDVIWNVTEICNLLNIPLTDAIIMKQNELKDRWHMCNRDKK